MPTQMHSVTTSSDYRVAPTDHLVFTDQFGFVLSQPIVGGTWASPSPHLQIGNRLPGGSGR